MFGRLLSFEPDATGVTVKFEHRGKNFLYYRPHCASIQLDGRKAQTIKGSCAGTKEG